ncbi:MAG: hypothetical protein ACK43K_14805 [Chitinophagales bacterium]|jgi:hypothetical protein
MKFASIKEKLFPKKVDVGGRSVPMRYAFTGASGHNYYHYIDAANDMNPARYIEYYLPMVKEYFLGIKRTELDIFFNKCKGYANIKQYEAAHLVMEERAKLNLDTGIIYDIMSVLYLRGDEKNEFVDQLFLQEKSKDIKNTMRASGGADNGFFLCPEFRNFLKSANLSDVDWNSYTRIAEKNLEMLESLLNLIRNSDQFKNIQSTPKK